MARLAGLLFCLIALCATDRAHAHAVLVESNPPDGAVLAQAPHEVVLRFNEPIAPVMVRALDIDARSIADLSQARVDNDTLRLALPPNLPPATYVVTFRIISIDSHPVSGTVVFSVGGASPVRDAGVSRRDPAVLTALIITRSLLLAAVLIAAGGVLALWRVAHFATELVRDQRRILGLSAIGALAVSPVFLGVVGCHLSGTSLAGLGDAATWRLALAATMTQSLVVAATGLVLMLVALPWLERGSNRMVAVAGSLIVIASFALTGHAATAAPQWLMRWAVPLHALCAAFWLGALPLLVSAIQAGPIERAHALTARFSTHAVAAVAVILVLGVAIAVVQVEHLAMLWQTPYGVILMGKVAAVALLLAVAAHNKWYALPLLARKQAGAAAPLRRAISAEYLLFAAILAFTAALGQIEPPRSAVLRDTQALAAGQVAFRESVEASGYKVTLSVAPARTGHNAFAVAIAKADGSAASPQEVTLDMSLPAAGIASIRRQAVRDASGMFNHHGNDLVLPGRWRIEVQVLVDDFTRVGATFEVEIR
jgi:copper transport protein